MTTRLEKVALLDAFMAAEKTVVLPRLQGVWLPVIRDGAALMVIGNPRRRDRLYFRLEVLYPAAICRLDFTDETHPNNAASPAENLPQLVHNEHYHSWPINRRFFKDFDHPVRLRNAEPYVAAGRSFDAVLRWFCESNRIAPLPPDHRIELPRLETLL